MSAPNNYSYAPSELARIRAHFADKLDFPCLIVGNGPSAAEANINQGLLDNAVVFRMNWFFLEGRRTFGERVDGFFCSVQNLELEKRVTEAVADGTYDIGAFFQPFLTTNQEGERIGSPVQAPMFDHWAAMASDPTLARFMMGRPLPTQGMQVLAFAAILGFKDIRLAGIDMYAAAAKRYAWEVPEDVRKHLRKKDVEGGYESHHSLELDLMYLRAIRRNFSFKLSGITNLELLAPFLDNDAPEQHSKRDIYTNKPALSAKKLQNAYVTYVEGDYVLGACALARSLEAVSDIPLIVTYSEPAVSRLLSGLKNVILHQVEPLKNPHEHGQERFAATYSKLRVFELVEYDRLVYVDADCIFLKSADELFESTEFQAAPNWGFELEAGFNSGVFAFSPTPELRDRVLTGIDDHSSADGGDQGYLNVVMADRWRALPPEYNTLKRVLVHHPTLVSLTEVKILHFVGKKPWELADDQIEYDFLSRYWLQFMDERGWQIFYWTAKRNARLSNGTGAKRKTRNRHFSSTKPLLFKIGRRIAPKFAIPLIKRKLRRVGLY